MIVKLERCNLSAAGVMSDAKGTRCLIPTNGYNFASVQAIARSGTWSAGVFKVRKTNDPSASEVADHSTAITITQSAPFSNIFRLESEYLALDCTTLEANVLVDVFVFLRKDNIAVS